MPSPTTGAVGLAASGLLLVLSAGPALAACDAYSGSCVKPPVVRSETRTPEPTVQGRAVVDTPTPAQLPFTGGELVLVSTLGAAALAGGTALVVAGRKRRSESA